MPEPVTPTPPTPPTVAPAPPSTRDDDALVKALAAEIRKPAPPAPAAPPSRDELLKRLDEAGKQGAGKFAEEFATTVLMPAQMQNVRHAAQLNRRMAEKDPETGKLYKRYRDKVEARVAELGGDAYIAEKGLDGIVRSVAAEDPVYIDEIADARLAEKVAAIEAAQKAKAAEEAAAGRRPPTETVHAGAAPAPAAHVPTEEEAIAKIEVSDEDATLARAIFRMTPTDVRRQRHEIAKMERRYGPIGIKQLGGVPIVELSTMRTGNGSPYPAEED